MNSELKVECGLDAGSSFSFELILPEVAFLERKGIVKDKAVGSVSAPAPVSDNRQSSRLI